MKIEDPDAIIVGSGAGGATAAHSLTAQGMRVVVLEKGPRRTLEDFTLYDELHFLEHKALIPSRSRDPNVYLDPKNGDRETTVERWWIGNMVGGSTMLWEANLPRYTEEDFKLREYLKDPPADASVVNWPWSYDEFQPYFEKAEHVWGVSGKANQAPAQEPTRPGYEYPMPPLRPHAQVPFLMEVFGKAGMQPYASPRGINTRTYDGRPACPFCGYCQNFGCAVNDRANAMNTVLAKALATGRCDLRVGHNVIRLDHENGRIQGVFYQTEPGGPVQHLRAPLVFVSVQAIESARLFLLSEIPNDNDHIGRYLTYHTKGGADLSFPDQPVWDEGPERKFQPRTSLGSLQLRDLYLINDPAAPELSKGGKFSIYDPFTIMTPIRMVTRAGLRTKTGIWGKELQERLSDLRAHGGAQLSFTGETLSRWENRVELDRDNPETGHTTVKDPWGQPVSRITYRHHDYDVKISRYCLQRVVDILVNAGGVLHAFDPQKTDNPGYGHNHGTLRAGADPETSVLDPDCQCHRVRGLYVLDCSWMPTAGASNPTLTLIANAYRVCDNLGRTGKARA